MDRVLVITGGAGGIGAATARLAASRGYAVAVNHLAAERAAAERLAGEIAAAGHRAISVEADVTDDDAVERLFDRAQDRLGRVTDLVNCAGVDGRKVPVCDLSGAELAALFGVNVVGSMLCCRSAIRRMGRRFGGAGGAIVNVSSMAATIGGRSGAAPYAASKAAIDAFTVGLAKEVAADGIRVNAVRPGMTRTAMTDPLADNPAKRADIAATIPMGRMATPEEIAAPIVWLLSPEASFVSGCRLDVSGGGFLVGMNRLGPPPRADDSS